MSKKPVVAAILAGCVLGAMVSSAYAQAGVKVPSLLGSTVIVPPAATPQNGPPGPKPPPKKN